jgi:STE24 endopeptidase
VTRKSKRLVDIPGLDMAKAKRYSRTRLAVLLVSTIWTIARLAWFARGGRSAKLLHQSQRLAPDRRLAGPIYFVLVTALSWLSGLPLAYLGGHRVERRFGLTKQSDHAWLSEQGKGVLLGLALQVPLTTAAYAVIRWRPRDWWLMLAGATVPLTVIFSNLAPVLIMPLFNRFVPVRDRLLADRVRTLADRAGVAIADVYEMDMSRQSEKPNAFFTGLGNTKRIVLGDTLIERFEPAEIDAVVAHELGHQVHGDIWRLIGLMSALGFAGAYALQRLGTSLVRKTAPTTGVRDIGNEASLPVLELVMAGLGFIGAPLMAAVSRAIERRTDRYALELTGNGDAYAATMARLATQSLADPDPAPAVVFFLYSHPPIAERIATARAFAARGSSTRPGQP